MRIQDQFLLALTMWRENRGGGREGMQSVGNVIANRAARHGTTVWEQCTRRLQFSSITAPGDPELTLWPSDGDVQWTLALDLAELAAAGVLEDITGGADLYYAPAGQTWKQRWTRLNGSEVPFPDHWVKSAVTFATEIAGQLFFRSK